MMRMLLLGKPGSGKGTQGRRLATHFALPILSTGELFRAAVAAGTPAGQAFKSYLDRGDLVPDDLVLQVIRDRLAQSDCRRGYLLDGFPRTVPQARSLQHWLTDQQTPLHLALHLQVPDHVLVQRAVGRRHCPVDGLVYHLQFAPPKKLDHCDRCGSALVQRSDDTADVVAARMAQYRTKTAPLLDYYRQLGLLHEVDGVGTLDEVAQRIEQVLPAVVKES